MPRNRAAKNARFFPLSCLFSLLHSLRARYAHPTGRKRRQPQTPLDGWQFLSKRYFLGSFLRASLKFIPSLRRFQAVDSPRPAIWKDWNQRLEKRLKVRLSQKHSTSIISLKTVTISLC
ncbi:Oidioi.mRNA.OKI2018_I69.XSR.g16341.t1.cds [Oikopleura dioica]|uniref:Oidioi.mRNA.OKI2018_I69.XSR.g16341.t1.cds n=1 Tax=Oikopleura dioica TaxID=34765 RepID=A0ABN7SJR6_OIKDI|nr:Oidioi.mRNA.OKI2018_I69.XSR.g16341.t1.cds [Oikopleura dioica]